MGETTGNPAQKPPKASREDRLKAALKANIGRRKAQARARSKPDEQKGADDDGLDPDPG